MDLSAPHTCVAPSVEGEVLVRLAATTAPLTGREVARLVRGPSQTSVNRALQRLADYGIVVQQRAGRAVLHSLNRAHLAAPAVELLANLRASLIRRLTETTAAWPVRAHHVSLFGSAARGDGTTGSDIDLFVVRRAGVSPEDARWRAQLEQLSRQVLDWTGNHASISEVSRSDVKRLRDSKTAIWRELMRDGVTVHGPSVHGLLRSR